MVLTKEQKNHIKETISVALLNCFRFLDFNEEIKTDIMFEEENIFIHVIINGDIYGIDIARNLKVKDFSFYSSEDISKVKRLCISDVATILNNHY